MKNYDHFDAYFVSICFVSTPRASDGHMPSKVIYRISHPIERLSSTSQAVLRETIMLVLIIWRNPSTLRTPKHLEVLVR